ncbi:MAG TPA: polysaccharide deacetylase family protein [Flavipsychrobacter sp.]|nr:polysaccharide deacetylase family protein [Flavipsychrobacter sp.]
MKQLKDLRRKLFSGKHFKSLILLYHHIAEIPIDPWEMAVTSKHFEDHLDVLANDYNIQPLSALSQQKDSYPQTTISLTFDDAYEDNYRNAFPLLKKLQLPATFFVATKILKNGHAFWWEVLEELLLGNIQLPEKLTLTLQGDLLYQCDIKPIETTTDRWSAWKGIAENQRQDIYLELAAKIKELPPDIQTKVTNQLLSWVGKKFSLSSAANKMSAKQLIEVQQSGLIEIGAHTVNHPALGNLPEEAQLKEIKESKKQLETLLQAMVNSFAYPHGHYNELTKSLVEEAGFTMACTTEENSFDGYNDPLILPRIWIKDWEKDQFANEIKKWLQN